MIERGLWLEPTTSPEYTGQLIKVTLAVTLSLFYFFEVPSILEIAIVAVSLGKLSINLSASLCHVHRLDIATRHEPL